MKTFFLNNASLGPVKNGPPVFLGNTIQIETAVSNFEFQCQKPYGWDSELLTSSKSADIWKRDKETLRLDSHEEIVFGGTQNDPPGGKSPPPVRGLLRGKNLILLRCSEIECLNY